jgi:hypothetical protein
VFVPRVGSRSPSPSFPVFYLFINHRLSQREKKGARYFSCFISNWYRLVVSFFFFRHHSSCVLFYSRFNGRDRKWQRSREKKRRYKYTHMCVGRKEMTPLIIYDQTFFGFFFFLSHFFLCLCAAVVFVCVRRSRPKGTKHSTWPRDLNVRHDTRKNKGGKNPQSNIAFSCISF